MMNIKGLGFLTVVLFLVMQVRGQDELDDLLNQMEKPKTEYVSATFKSTRVINLHSVELMGKQAMDFRISHRFGSVNGGAYELFGLDQATMRLALEYGVTDWIMVGVGRSTYEKTYDGFTKLRLLRQSTGLKKMPITLTYFGSMTVNGLKWENPDRQNFFTSRLAYVNQLIIARKFNSSLSLQFSPTIIHKNLVPTDGDQNTSGALGFSGRYKITKRMSVNAEYIWRIPPPHRTKTYDSYYNSFSVGVDIETGGHVFALHLSNSLPMMEKGFITETNKSWKDGGVHLGFNISREFDLSKKAKP